MAMPSARNLAMPVTAALALGLSLLGTGALGAAEPPALIGPLQTDDVSPGCRCSFSLRPQTDAGVPLVFALDLPTGEGLVRVGGALVRLTRLSSEESRKRKQKETVGDRFEEVWSGGSTQVTLRYRTTFVCPEKDTVCAHTDYEGKMTVEHGSSDERYEVWGSCGCPSGS